MRQRTLGNRSWNYSLVDANADLSTSRSGCKPGFASRLVGIDPIEMRPFHGFKYFTALDSGAGTLTFVRSVTIRTGSQDFTGGFIYRKGTSIYFKQVVPSVTAALELKTGVSATAQMDVATYGRLVYVFVQGEEPFLFYFNSTTPVVVYDTGPGTPPVLNSPDQTVTLGTMTGEGGQVVFTSQRPDSFVTPLGLGQNQVASAVTVRSLGPGNYTFAYQLYDSRSGRWGHLSKIAIADSSTFGRYQATGTITGSGAPGSGGVNAISSVTGAAQESRFAAIEIAYDTAKWDTAYVYRSVRTESAGGTTAAALLLLDRVVTLANYRAYDWPSSSGISGFGSGSGTTYGSGSGLINAGGLDRAIYWYELDDKQLVVKGDLYADSPDFQPEMPRGGAACFYEGSMLVGALRQGAVSFDSNLGELRWSSLVRQGPELFSSRASYTPSIPTAEVLRIVQVGPNAIGFGRDRLYMVRKESTFIKVQEMHEGIGITNPNAVATFANSAYFVSDKGLKFIDSTGQLDDVRGVDDPIYVKWRDTQAGVCCGYDPTLGIVVVHNPDYQTGHTLLLWTVGKITELEDTSPFKFLEQGAFPVDWSGASPTGTLKRRLFFITNTGNIYLIDAQRSRYTEGTTKYTASVLMHPPDYDKLVWQVDEAVAAGDSVVTVKTTPAWDFTSPRYLDCYLYVISDPTIPANVGKRVRILGQTGGTGTLDIDSTAGFAVGTDAWVGISPVKVAWNGAPLSEQMDNGMEGAPDFVSQKTSKGVKVAFDSLFGPSIGQTYATFMGVVYRGDAITPTARGWPMKRDGTYAAGIASADAGLTAVPTATQPTVVTARQGTQGSNLTVGFEVFCPRCDYTLLAVRVEGEMVAGDRTDS